MIENLFYKYAAIYQAMSRNCLTSVAGFFCAVPFQILNIFNNTQNMLTVCLRNTTSDCTSSNFSVSSIFISTICSSYSPTELQVQHVIPGMLLFI